MAVKGRLKKNKIAISKKFLTKNGKTTRPKFKNHFKKEFLHKLIVLSKKTNTALVIEKRVLEIELPIPSFLIFYHLSGLGT
jgi:hypothetical protein